MLGRGRRSRARLSAQPRQPLQHRADRKDRLGPGLSIPEPAHEAVRGDVGDPAATRVALPRCLPTVSASKSSSLPRPWDCKVLSEGCTAAGAGIADSFAELGRRVDVKRRGCYTLSRNRCSPIWKRTTDSTTIWDIRSQRPFWVRLCSAYHEPLGVRNRRTCRGSQKGSSGRQIEQVGSVPIQSAIQT